LVTVSGAPSSPRWSPDGKRIRFTISSDTATSIWEVSASGSDLHVVFPDWRNPHCCGIWTTDGKYFVFQATSKGVGTIWAMREKSGLFKRDSHGPVQLTNGPINNYAPVPSANGKRLFFGGHQPRSEIVRYDSKSKTFVPFLSGTSAEGLDFSRDGKWVAYVSYPEGALWKSTIDGERRLQLTTPPIHVGLPRWSPDGKRIAFMGQYPGQPWRIFTASAEGGALQQITNGQDSTDSDQHGHGMASQLP
jgi:Tol biopolymer transport system component